MSAITLSDYRNALFTILQAEQAASPTLLRKVFRQRPGGIGEAPVAWIGTLQEQINIDAGTRAREALGEILIAAPYPTDILEAADPFDALYSELVERFTLTATATMLNNSILELIAISQGDLTLEGAGQSTSYNGMTLTTRLRIWEGRD